MTKAEERALEFYPVTMVRRRYDGIARSDDPYDSNLHDRYCFQRGYELAEKDLGWISVKDRLPEVGHFVLTCVSDTGTPQCVGMALLLEDGTWWDGDMKVRVDYWMEVPKLKEEKK